MTRPPDLLRGTLETLVLKALRAGPMHGYAVARWLEASSAETLHVEEGSLYPALYRMEERGLVVAEWGVSELGRKAKMYRLTRRGRVQLEERTRAWQAFSAAVSRVLLEEPGA